ncbi:hypothetical protein ACIOKD_13835 [Streptomyces sp. NPDC087844]|uniref:hypothetical protein n=1 Tax=Streptomyces sp. NPDC087844 TaxID=3365805 RepID=UPI00380875FE
MAIGARPVGRALERQPRPAADHVVGHGIEDCDAIISLHRPDEPLGLLGPFLAAGEQGKQEQPLLATFNL